MGAHMSKHVWIIAIVVGLCTANSASAGSVFAPKPSTIKSGYGTAKKFARDAVITETITSGAKLAARRAKEIYQREKRCRNTQGGNTAHSTAAVRSC
jgi:hypothetical protein